VKHKLTRDDEVILCSQLTSLTPLCAMYSIQVVDNFVLCL